MVSLGASLAAKTVFAAVPVVGWVVSIAAAYIDAKYIIPLLNDDGTQDFFGQKLLSVPTGSQDAGSPTYFGIGRRVRMPAHPIFQSRKYRETTPSQKNGSQITQKQVFCDTIIAVNTRKSERFVQLIGNGRLLMWNERNLVKVTTSAATGSWTAGSYNITITASSLQAPTFYRVLKVNDLVELTGWIPSVAGYDVIVNSTVYVVTAVTDHGTTPSTITVMGVQDQLLATAGTLSVAGAISPASITRLDDTVDIFTDVPMTGSVNPSIVPAFNFRAPDLTKWRLRFSVGDLVTVTGLTHTPPTASIGNGATYRVASMATGYGGGFNDTFNIVYVSGPGTTASSGLWGTGSTNNRAILRLSGTQTVASGFFPSGYNPNNYFQDGREGQSPPSMLTDREPFDEVPGYRGVALLSAPSWNVTQIGGSLPFNLEVVLDVDRHSTLRSAILELLARAGYNTATEADVTTVPDEPFEGMYVRGAVSPKLTLQAIMVAKRLLVQERAGKLVFFSLSNADVLTLTNTVDFTDFGWNVGEAEKLEPYMFEDGAVESLATAVSIDFQDPDLGYTQGNHTFSLRSPVGVVNHQKLDSLDLSTVVLRRNDVSVLAQKTLRDSWVNGTIFRTTLSSSYVFLLENDLLAFQTTDGTSYVVRIISRNVTPSYLVEITGLVENLDISIITAAYSTPAFQPPAFPALPVLSTLVLDIPATKDAESQTPGLVIAVAAGQGAAFAGATVFESFDNATWNAVAVVGNESLLGTAQTALLSGTPAQTLGTTTLTLDATNTVDVQFTKTSPALTSCVEADVRAGLNWFVITDEASYGYWEIFGARTITHLGGGLYRLSNLYRGLRGTHGPFGAGSTKAVGSRVLMVSDTAGLAQYVFRNYPGLVGVSTLYFRIVPAGGNIDSAPTLTATVNWGNCRPLRTRKIVKTIKPSNDIKIETDNDTRRVLRLGAVGPYPMDESFEQYRFTLYDSAFSSISLQKFLTANGSGSATLRNKSVVFTAAELTTAGYTPGPSLSINIDVQQVGDYGDSDGQPQTI